MRTSISVQIALSLAVAVTPASAITIDNFEEGPFSLSTSNSAQCHDLPPPLPPGIRICEDTQSGLSTLNVISGQRSVFLQPSGSGTAELALTAGDDAAVVDIGDGQNGFSYAFASPFDLTQGGTLDRFVVDITAASGLELVLIVAQRSSGIGGPNLFFSESLQISGSGAFTVLFSDLRYSGLPPGPVLDFTQVDGVVMYFVGIGSISNIAAIPEPSTALLVITGLLGLAGWRRAGTRS